MIGKIWQKELSQVLNSQVTKSSIMLIHLKLIIISVKELLGFMDVNKIHLTWVVLIKAKQTHLALKINQTLKIQTKIRMKNPIIFKPTT